MTGVCKVIPTYINAFASGAEVIIDVGVNAPGMKMSKGSRKQLDDFIKEASGVLLYVVLFYLLVYIRFLLLLAYLCFL